MGVPRKIAIFCGVLAAFASLSLFVWGDGNEHEISSLFFCKKRRIFAGKRVAEGRENKVKTGRREKFPEKIIDFFGGDGKICQKIFALPSRVCLTFFVSVR